MHRCKIIKVRIERHQCVPMFSGKIPNLFIWLVHQPETVHMLASWEILFQLLDQSIGDILIEEELQDAILVRCSRSAA